MALPIRRRLALASGGLVVAVVMATGALVYARLESDLRTVVDDGLRSRAEALAEATIGGPEIVVAASDIGDIFARIMASRCHGQQRRATRYRPAIPLVASPSHSQTCAFLRSNDNDRAGVAQLGVILLIEEVSGCR